MAKVTFVKKARKAIKGTDIKKGDSYYWWAPGFRGPKRYSKTQPKPSQTTANEFLSAVYSIQEDMDEFSEDDRATIQEKIEEWKGQIEEARDQLQDKFDNMPQGFQDGDTGQEMQTRINDCDSWIGELDNIDPEDEDCDPQDIIEAIQQSNPGSF